MPGGNTYNTTNTTDTSQDNSLPDWAAPYFERNVARAEAAFGTEFDPYRGDRIAGGNDDINASRDMARGIAGQSLAGIDEARQFATDGMQRANDLGNYDPSSFTETAFDPNQFSAAEFDPNRFSQAEFDPSRFSEAQFGPAGQFDSNTAQQYMSPFQQNVTDVNKAAAFQDFQRMQGSRDAAAVNAGAFGGSRQGVVQGMAEQDLMDNFGRIQAEGSQAAFENAQSQFGADRTAGLEVDRARADEMGRVDAGRFDVDRARADDLGRVQDGRFDVDRARADDLGRVQDGQFDVNRAAADERGRVDAGRAGENQFGAQQGLAGLSAGSELAAGLVDIGARERQNAMDNAQLREGIGLAEQDEEQRQMDLDYQNYTDERDFMKNQVGGMTNILNGQPIAPTGSMTGTSSSVGTTPGPSTFQQIAGAGLAGIGIYNGGMG